MLTTIIFYAVLVTAVTFSVAAAASFLAGRFDLGMLYFGMSLANASLTWMSRG